MFLTIHVTITCLCFITIYGFLFRPHTAFPSFCFLKALGHHSSHDGIFSTAPVSVPYFSLSSTFLFCPTFSYSLWSLCSFSNFHSSLLDSLFPSIPLVFPLPIFLSSCRPFISSSAHDELRYKVMDACLCGTSLLIVFHSPPSHSLFPPHLSLYLPIPPASWVH